MRSFVTVLAPLAACALLVGCSSDDSPRALTQPSASTGATATPGTGTSAAASPGQSASAVPGGGSGTQPTDGITTGSGSTATSQPTHAPATALKGTAAGEYTYDLTGSYSLGGPPSNASGTSTLTVTALAGNRQRTTLTSDRNETAQDLVVQADGVHLARLTISPPVDKTFAPSPAVLLFPDRAPVGTSWSWQASSTDGSSTVRTTNKVARTETLTIGGQRVATVVLQTHLVITGSTSYTADVTTWVATAYRLPVKDHTVGSGSWGTLRFSTDVTSVMRSVHPA